MVAWPMIAMIVEVLPAPFGPSSASTDPAGTSMLTSSTARITPYPQLSRSSRSMLLPCAEVGLADGGIGHDVGRRGIADHSTLIEDEKTTAHAHDLGQIVLNQYRGDARGIDGGEDINQFRRFAVIEPGQRLVEENKNWLDRQRARD